MAEEIERIYVIPLKKNGFKGSKAANSAVKRVKSYLTKHMKVEDKNIWIDDSLNNALWEHGKYSMASKIRVKAVKFDDGVVEAYLPELEFKKSRRELLKEEREAKEPILRKEEIEAGEGEEETGAEDYDIAPSGDGEVKIKKKKAPKEKKETDEKIEKKPVAKKKKEIKAEEKPKKEGKSKKKPASKKSTTKKTTTKKTSSKSSSKKKKSSSKK